VVVVVVSSALTLTLDLDGAFTAKNLGR